jgi:enoyl-CoA hydratase/carnithine racemase
MELAFFEELLKSEDYQEGLQALTEGRKPKFKGH